MTDARMTAIATEYAAILEEIDEARDALRRLEDHRDDFARAIRDRMSPGDPGVKTPRGWLVVLAGTMPKRRVLPDRAIAHREVLDTLGLGHVEDVYHPPTLAEVRAKEAALAARGVTIDDLAPPGVPGVPRVVITDDEGE